MTNVRTINYTELLLRAKLLMYKTTMMTPSMAIKLKYYPIKQQAACINTKQALTKCQLQVVVLYNRYAGV